MLVQPAPSTIWVLPTALTGHGGQQLPSFYCWENRPHSCARRKQEKKSRKQVSAPRVRDPAQSHPCRHRSSPSKKSQGAAGSWEGKTLGQHWAGWAAVWHSPGVEGSMQDLTHTPLAKPGCWGKAEPLLTQDLDISDSGPRPECCLFSACLHAGGSLGGGLGHWPPYSYSPEVIARLAMLCQCLVVAGVIPMFRQRLRVPLLPCKGAGTPITGLPCSTPGVQRSLSAARVWDYAPGSVG